MKKILLVLGLLFFSFSQSCLAYVTIYQSKLGNYIRAESINKYYIAETDQELTLTLYRDATFTHHPKANEPLVTQLGFLEFSLTNPGSVLQPKDAESAQKKKKLKIEDEQLIYFAKKRLPKIFFNNAEKSFLDKLEISTVSEFTLRTEVTEKQIGTFPTLQSVTLILPVAKKDILEIALPPEILADWNQIISLDMKLEREKALSK